MSSEPGYYGYTEGELVIRSGSDGTVGVQLEQGFPKHRILFPTRNSLGRNERKRPAKAAIAQALRFEFGLGPVAIGKLLKMTPQDATRETVGDYFKGIPWEHRRYRKEAIAAAKEIIARSASQ